MATSSLTGLGVLSYRTSRATFSKLETYLGSSPRILPRNYSELRAPRLTPTRFISKLGLQTLGSRGLRSPSSKFLVDEVLGRIFRHQPAIFVLHGFLLNMNKKTTARKSNFELSLEGWPWDSHFGSLQFRVPPLSHPGARLQVRPLPSSYFSLG